MYRNTRARRPAFRVLRCVVFLVCGIFSIASLAAGQGTEASITGIVTDASGAVLPGTTVTISSPALQVAEMNMARWRPEQLPRVRR
jgi:hypothetical protein